MRTIATPFCKAVVAKQRFYLDEGVRLAMLREQSAMDLDEQRLQPSIDQFLMHAEQYFLLESFHVDLNDVWPRRLKAIAGDTLDLDRIGRVRVEQGMNTVGGSGFGTTITALMRRPPSRPTLKTTHVLGASAAMRSRHPQRTARAPNAQARPVHNSLALHINLEAFKR
jgi:hypothetical protein